MRRSQGGGGSLESCHTPPYAFCIICQRLAVTAAVSAVAPCREISRMSQSMAFESAERARMLAELDRYNWPRGLALDLHKVMMQ